VLKSSRSKGKENEGLRVCEEDRAGERKIEMQIGKETKGVKQNAQKD